MFYTGASTQSSKERNQKRVRKNWLKHAYGTTPEHVERVELSQRGLCPICCRPLATVVKVVDHKGPVVRGVLCHACNLVLGHAYENCDTLQRAIEYLRRYQ